MSFSSEGEEEGVISKPFWSNSEDKFDLFEAIPLEIGLKNILFDGFEEEFNEEPAVVGGKFVEEEEEEEVERIVRGEGEGEGDGEREGEAEGEAEEEFPSFWGAKREIGLIKTEEFE